MKMNRLVAAAAAVCATISLAGCGGGSGSAPDSKFFGDLPGIYTQMMEKKQALKEEFKNAKSEEEGKKLFAEADEAEKEYSVKIEEAAKALDGKTIEIESTPQFTVKTPVTLKFDGFASKISLAPRFKLSGDVVA